MARIAPASRAAVCSFTAALLTSSVLASGALAQERPVPVHVVNDPAPIRITRVLPPSLPSSQLPTGGQVVSGDASIRTNGRSMQIDQRTDQMIANWQSFSIGADNSVIFNQPNASSVALNRVLGQDPSQILGSLIANGRVFLINPNGIVIGKEGSVAVGGFVASTLGISDADFLAGNYRFVGNGGQIINSGDLKGGVVALIAPRVVNDGTVAGDTAMAAGTDVTLDFNGDGLIAIEVDASSLQTLVENNGMIDAGEGLVVLTARGANDAMKGVVNNTGIIEARGIGEKNGRILLLGDMNYGELEASGTLAASFVETSAANVRIDDGLIVDTNGGEWLIDPNDFTIAASGGNISGTALSNNLANGNVTITTATQGTPNGNGDIFVNDTVTWSQNILTLRADRSIFINTEMFGSGTAGLALEYAQSVEGGDYFVNAPVNLPSAGSFATKKSSQPKIEYTIITELGSEGDLSNYTLQGLGLGRTALPAFVLGKSIDASQTRTWNGGRGFRPINASNILFDGLGHTISSLYINRPDEDLVGLFRSLSGIFSFSNSNSFEDFTFNNVRNLNIVQADVTGEDRVGILFGTASNASTIKNIHVDGIVRGILFVGGIGGDLGRLGEISASFSGANVRGRLAGGLVGLSRGQIISSASTGDVTGDEVGGLVGALDNGNTVKLTNDRLAGVAEIRDSSASGKITSTGYAAGGLVGNLRGFVVNSIFTGLVSGGEHTGGLIGVEDIVDPGKTGGLENSFWLIEGNTGLLACGLAFGVCQARGLNSAEARDPSIFEAAGWDFRNVWNIDPNRNDGLPFIRAIQPVEVAPPPPPPPPPPANNLGVDPIGNLETDTAPFQPTISLTGTAFRNVTEIVFTFTDPDGVTGTVTWNEANGFGGGRFVVISDAEATIAPVLVAAGDPAGDYRWSVTIKAGEQSVTRNFTVTLTQAVAPPPPPPPPPPAANQLSLTSGIPANIEVGSAPFRPTLQLVGSGFNNVTEIAFLVTDPAGNVTPFRWNAGNGLLQERFTASSDSRATIMPGLLSANDAPGIYRWSVTISAGEQSVTRNFTVNFGGIVVQDPVRNVDPVNNNTESQPIWGFVRGDAEPGLIDFGTAGSTAPTSPQVTVITSRENASPEQLQAASDFWEYATLSNNVYRNGNEFPNPEGLTLVGDSGSMFGDLSYAAQTNAGSTDPYLSPNQLGFYSETYVRTEGGKVVEVVMVFKGTEDGADWMWGNLSSAQESLARQYAMNVIKEYGQDPSVKFTATGHSLGGALAKVVANTLDVKAVVFNDSPRNLTTKNVITIQESGDPLNILRTSDYIYNFGNGDILSEHSIFNLARGMRGLIGR